VKGIRHQTTVPYTPQQNGVVERVNRTAVEKARSMLLDAGLSKKYWAEAVNTAIYLKNRSPMSAVQDVTPEEAWREEKVNLKIFGRKALMHVPKENHKQWGTKSKEHIFVGYYEETRGITLLIQRIP
jgi:transposase InsO family protein